LQKQQRHSSLRSISKQVVFFACILFLFFAFSSFSVIRVKTVNFISEDGLQVTADEYIIEPDNPYILLFHEQGSSRGEFTSIARRLCKMDYNCLAVDLRNGGNSNFVSNETTKAFNKGNLESGFNDIELDVLAAINYASKKTSMPLVLFGSGVNGSISLKVAVTNENVRAVVALSPGEYFIPEIKIQNIIASLQKPVFISSSKDEFPYVSILASGIDEHYITLFEPKQGPGDRGTASLSLDYEQNTEYWIALIRFFKDLI
jgi:dienelactone hydrolase